MPKHKDMTGLRFERMTVLYRAENDMHQNAMWLCRCDCGAEKIVRGASLRTGHIVSCGCLKAEKASDRITVANRTHGQSNTRLYRIWSGMKDRCNNPRNGDYKHYGGRGITVCEEWLHSFEAFRDWALANGYQDDLTIDRRDPNDDYNPKNCCWATRKEQTDNRRITKRLTVGGVTKTLSEWAQATGTNIYTIRGRIRLGWSPEEIVYGKSANA